jgi:hypothetical protein
MDGVIIKPCTAWPWRYGKFDCRRCRKPYRTRFRTRPKIYCKRCRELEKREADQQRAWVGRDRRAAKAVAAGRVPGHKGRKLASLGGAGEWFGEPMGSKPDTREGLAGLETSQKAPRAGA